MLQANFDVLLFGGNLRCRFFNRFFGTGRPAGRTFEQHRVRILCQLEIVLAIAGLTDALQTIPIIVIDPSSYEITVDIPAFEASRVKVGQDVLLTPGNLPATHAFDNRQPNGPHAATAKGTVFSVNPAVNPGGRSVQMVIRSTSGAEKLQDGMFTTCWIQVESSDDAIVAPLEAFLFEENQPYVFAIVADESDSAQLIAKRRLVSIGIQGLDSRQITTGINAGDRIATTGRYRLVDGAPVAIIETATFPNGPDASTDPQ